MSSCRRAHSRSAVIDPQLVGGHALFLNPPAITNTHRFLEAGRNMTPEKEIEAQYQCASCRIDIKSQGRSVARLHLLGFVSLNHSSASRCPFKAKLG